MSYRRPPDLRRRIAQGGTVPKVSSTHPASVSVDESKPREEEGKRSALVLFVGYQSAFRQAASYVIDREPDVEVVAQSGSLEEGRKRTAYGDIDAAIVDTSFFNEGAPEMVRALREASPSVTVLAMTALEDPAIHEEMVRAGAAEVLTVDVHFGEVLAALRRIRKSGLRLETAPG